MDPEGLSGLNAPLLAWFAGARRPLAFREDRSPYRVLVAEFMLQQTRSNVVESYYRRFVRRFPDVVALAEASPEEVLAHWQGLGYYARARRLHEAARRIVAQHAGMVPRDPQALRALPGVGPYVAAAVGAFAFERDEAALDANVRRVLARVANVPAIDERVAAALVPPGRAREWNEALMDLGATICTARRPRCPTCPLTDVCRANRAGTQELVPARVARAVRPVVLRCLVAVRDEELRWGLVRRPPRGLLAGLWEFPSADGADPAAALATHDVWAEGLTELPPFRHTFTHLVWDVRPFLARGGGPLRWVRPAELPTVPLTGPTVRVVRHVAGAAPGLSK